MKIEGLKHYEPGMVEKDNCVFTLHPSLAILLMDFDFPVCILQVLKHKGFFFEATQAILLNS